MGRVILCNGSRAQQPYVFKSTNKKVYSIEEMCYYFSRHYSMLEEDIREPELSEFLREELLLTERADRLSSLLEAEADSKELLACILYSCDYHTEEEIQELFDRIDVFRKLPLSIRKKRYADECLSNGRYQEAMKEYSKLLNTQDASDLTDQEYGDILHNTGVIQANNGAFLVACENFYEAYSRNQNKESLSQYFFALKLSGKQEIETQMMEQLEDSSFYTTLEERFDTVAKAMASAEEFVLIHRLKGLKEQGKIKEYHSLIKEVIGHLKQEYRRMNG